MLSADEILAALAGLDPTVKVWVLAHLDNGHALEAQRLLLANLPTDQWDRGKELVASLSRQRVLRRVAA